MHCSGKKSTLICKYLAKAIKSIKTCLVKCTTKLKNSVKHAKHLNDERLPYQTTKNEQIFFEKPGDFKKWYDNEYGLRTTIGTSVYDVAITYDNKYAIFANTGGTVRMWNLQNKRLETVLRCYPSEHFRVALTHNNKFIVSGGEINNKGEEGEIVVWSLQEKHKETTFYSTYGIIALAITQDDKYAISGSRYSTIIVWNLAEYCKEIELNNSLVFVNTMVFSYDCKYAASVLYNTVIVRNLHENKIEAVLQGNREEIYTVKFSRDGKYVVAGGSDIFVWNLYEKELEIRPGFGTIIEIAISHDNKYFICGTKGQSIKVWNFDERQLEFKLRGHKERVENIAVSEDNKYAVSGSWDHSVRLWNLQEKRQEAKLKDQQKLLDSGVITSNKKYIVFSGKDNIVRVWKLSKSRMNNINS